MVKRSVRLTSTNNGTTATGSTWFMTTPKLGYSLDGFRTTTSTYAPKVGQSVTVTSTARDTAGNPVAGLPVTWTWQYSSGYVTTLGVTNSSGVATSTMAITSTTETTKVTVVARVQSGSENRSSTTGFTRQWLPPRNCPMERVDPCSLLLLEICMPRSWPRSFQYYPRT